MVVRDRGEEVQLLALLGLGLGLGLGLWVNSNRVSLYVCKFVSS